MGSCGDMYISAVAEKAGCGMRASLMAVHLKNGKAVSEQADFAKGSPADPMTMEEVKTKFRGCAECAGWSKSKTDAIIEAVSGLERAPDVKQLAKLLTR